MPLSESAVDQEQQQNKFFMALALIKLQTDAASVRDQILASPTIPTLDDVMALLLWISSNQDQAEAESTCASNTKNWPARR